MYTQTDIEMFKRVRELRDEDGFTLEQIAKFIKKFQTGEAAATSALAVMEPSETGVIPAEFQEIARQMLSQMVQEATLQVKGYVDEQIGKVSTNTEVILNNAIDKMDRLSEQRSQELSRMLTDIMEKKKKKGLWNKMFK